MRVASSVPMVRLARGPRMLVTESYHLSLSDPPTIHEQTRRSGRGQDKQEPEASTTAGAGQVSQPAPPPQSQAGVGQAFQPDTPHDSQAGKPDLHKSQAGKPDLRPSYAR